MDETWLPTIDTFRILGSEGTSLVVFSIIQLCPKRSCANQETLLSSYVSVTPHSISTFPPFFFCTGRTNKATVWLWPVLSNIYHQQPPPRYPFLRPLSALLITLTSDFEMGESAALKAGLGQAACDLNLLFISQRAGSVKRTRNITAPAVILCHQDQKASSTFQNHISTLGPKAPFNPHSIIAWRPFPDSVGPLKWQCISF